MSLTTFKTYVYLLFTLMALTMTISAQGEILLVNASATGPGSRIASVTADDWNNANAYTSLQSALEASQNGDEIWVKAGTYKPTQNATLTSTGPTDRSNTFSITSGISFYGGFAGNETDLSSRNAAINPTILSGDLNGNDVVTGSGKTLSFSHYGENALHVVLAYNITQNTKIDGFTISGGNANLASSFLGLGNGNACGGGLFIRQTGSYLTVTNCSFIKNAASTTISGRGGAAIYINIGYPVISNCNFQNNKARNGGAVMIQGAVPLISNCVFSYNLGTFSGGALYNYGSNYPEITNCVFTNNYSKGKGGSILNDSNAKIILSNCVFTSEAAASQGGVINNSSNSLLKLKFCTIYDNKVNSATGVGGAIFCSDNSGGEIENCIIYNNTTPNNSADAGMEEIYSLNTTSTQIIVSNSLVRDAFPLSNVTDGGKNFSADPLFLNFSDADGIDDTWMTNDDGLSLSQCSPAIDSAGSRAGTDLLGSSEMDGDGNGEILSDIGAYEFPEVSFSPSSFSTADINDPYSQNLSVSGLAGLITWNIESGSLPSGLSLNTTTGEVSGTPDIGGTFQFTVTADVSGCNRSREYSLVVYDPLPVTYNSFIATRLDRVNVQLTWETSTEISNQGFEVQRSTNGNEFKAIGFQQGESNTLNGNSYQFTDNHPGDVYYRLKQFDYNGHFSYSEILFVPGKEILIDAYPNPFTDFLIVKCSEEIDLEITLQDINGRQINFILLKDTNILFIKTEEIPSGIYLLHISSDDKLITKKVIRQ